MEQKIELTKNQQRRLDERAYRDNIQVTISKMTREIKRAEEREAKKAETRKIGDIDVLNRRDARLQSQKWESDKRKAVRKQRLDVLREQRKQIAKEAKSAKKK